jgi:diacylglycerol kinase family enzyme
MNKKIVYLLNPKASDERSMELWDKAKEKYSFLPEKPYYSTEIPDIAGWVKKEKPDIIAIAGGDGTINKITQAILPLIDKPMLSIIPMGTGNALSYCLGVDTLEKALFVLREQPKSIAIDVMKTNIPELPIGVFNLSVGFDARIVFNRVSYRYIGWKSYILSAVRSVFSHPEKEITFTIDKKVTLKATASSLVV